MDPAKAPEEAAIIGPPIRAPIPVTQRPIPAIRPVIDVAVATPAATL